MKAAPRFPLPVSHSRAPFSVSRAQALLIAVVVFGAGYATALYTIGFIITAR